MATARKNVLEWQDEGLQGKPGDYDITGIPLHAHTARVLHGRSSSNKKEPPNILNDETSYGESTMPCRRGRMDARKRAMSANGCIQQAAQKAPESLRQ